MITQRPRGLYKCSKCRMVKSARESDIVKRIANNDGNRIFCSQACMRKFHADARAERREKDIIAFGGGRIL